MQVKLIANPGKWIDVGILLMIASATIVALLRFPEYHLGLIPTRKLLPPAVWLLTFAGLVMAIFSRFIWLRRRLRERIAHKILFFTALILIFSGAGAGFLATLFMGGSSEHALKYHLQQDNDRLASTLNQEIAKRRQEISALAKDQRLKSFLGGGRRPRLTVQRPSGRGGRPRSTNLPRLACSAQRRRATQVPVRKPHGK